MNAESAFTQSHKAVNLLFLVFIAQAVNQKQTNNKKHETKNQSFLLYFKLFCFWPMGSAAFLGGGELFAAACQLKIHFNNSCIVGMNKRHHTKSVWTENISAVVNRLLKAQDKMKTRY